MTLMAIRKSDMKRLRLLCITIVSDLKYKRYIPDVQTCDVPVPP